MMITLVKCYISVVISARKFEEDLNFPKNDARCIETVMHVLIFAHADSYKQTIAS